MPGSIDHAEYIIRNVKLADAEALLDIECAIISEGDYFVSESAELKREPLQEKEEQIRTIMDNIRETLIVAEVNGAVVGSVVFRSENRKRLSHTGAVAMSISKIYRGMGIGKALLKALLLNFRRLKT
jgi:L-amino acid N-acyltransferase YncA